MAEKGKSRGASAKSKSDKSQTSARAQGRQSKKTSPKSSRHTSARHTPSPVEAAPANEPVDVGPILNALLDRVLTECAVAAAARQRIPFTVSRARDAILFVAEWRFLVRDEGDPGPEGDPNPERDGIWSKDEEPQSYPLDRMTPCIVPVDYDASSEESSSEDLSETAEAESPLVGPGEVPDAAPVPAVPLSPEHVPPEDFPVTAEAESLLVRPGEVPDAVPVPAVPPPPDQVPSAAPAAAPAQVLGADIDEPEPGPPRLESLVPPRPRERGRQLSRDYGRGGILTQPPERGRRLSWAPERSSQRPRPPRPRPAPPDAPRPRAALPAEPSEPPAQAPQVPREGTAKVSHQMPPLPPSGPSLVSMQPRKPSLSTGVPRLGARRVAARRVLPEVRVVDVSGEPEWGRTGASRSRLLPLATTQVLPGTGRARKAEPQLCDPWLASARLAPGVTVRWGRSERRGPALPGHDERGDDEQDDETVKRSDKELKPILAYPECRLSEYDE